MIKDNLLPLMLLLIRCVRMCACVYKYVVCSAIVYLVCIHLCVCAGVCSSFNEHNNSVRNCWLGKVCLHI